MWEFSPWWTNPDESGSSWLAYNKDLSAKYGADWSQSLGLKRCLEGTQRPEEGVFLPTPNTAEARGRFTGPPVVL